MKSGLGFCLLVLVHFSEVEQAMFLLQVYLYSISVFHLYSFRYAFEAGLLEILQLGGLFQYYWPVNDMNTKMKSIFLREQGNGISYILSTLIIKKKIIILTRTI